MKTLKKLLIWGIPILLLVGLVIWRFAGLKAAQAQIARGGPGGAGGPGGPGGGRGGAAAVQVATAGSRHIVQAVEAVANVESPYRIDISPKASGRIDFLQAREGDRVTAGQVLLRINPSDLQGAVLQAQASVAEARSRLAQAQLTSGSNNVGIASQIQQQQAAVASAEADYNQVQQNLNAQIAAAQAQVNSAQDAINNAQAALGRENANLQAATSRLNRTRDLESKGYVSTQQLEDAQNAVAVAQSAVQVAQGQVSSAKSQLNVQQQNLTITKRKGQADISASKARLTQAKAALNVAISNRAQSPAYQQNIAALRSQVDAAVAQLKQAQVRVGETTVRSPINGTVTSRTGDPGALASPGTAVLVVQFLDWLYVTAALPIEASGQVREGDRATITLDGIPGKTFTGPITNVNAAADPASRQFTIRVKLDNRDHLVRPGMYGRVAITTSEVDADVVVPKEALTTNAAGVTTVAVVDSENVAHVRTVKLGAKDERGVQILEGVNKGDKVVILTFNPLREGAKVTVSAPGQGGGRGAGGGRRRGAGGSGGGGGARQPGGGSPGGQS